MGLGWALRDEMRSGLKIGVGSGHISGPGLPTDGSRYRARCPVVTHGSGRRGSSARWPPVGSAGWWAAGRPDSSGAGRRWWLCCSADTAPAYSASPGPRSTCRSDHGHRRRCRNTAELGWGGGGGQSLRRSPEPLRGGRMWGERNRGWQPGRETMQVWAVLTQIMNTI